MANTTWLAATNKILELAGQLQIAGATDFNLPTTNLTRIQSQARAWIEIVNRELDVKETTETVFRNTL